MHDAQSRRPVGRARSRGLKRTGFAVIAALGLTLAAAGFTQSNRDLPSTSVQAHGRLPSLAPVVQAVLPAVVRVAAVETSRASSGGKEDDLGLRRSKRRSANRALPSDTLGETIRSTGSGFIIDPSGLIVTEEHVIENAEEVTVTFQDGTRHPARIIGRDAKTDLALLKVEVDQALPHVGWGDSDAVRVGDWVVAIGNPFGLDATVTSGIISGRGRHLADLGSYDDFLQIDAAINPGNSGGPTFDLDGRVIGINTALYSPNTGSVGIGFAVPANLARPVIAQLKTSGKVERGWLGVRIQELTPELAQGFGLSKAEGGLVADLTAGGPAARAGFTLGDVILSVNGKVVAKKHDLLLALAAMPIGQKAEMRVWRQGGEVVLRPVIGEMPTSPQFSANAPPGRRSHRNNLITGLRVGPLTEARRDRLEIPLNVTGVIVLSIDDDSAFQRSGLRPGDVIESIDQRRIISPGEVTLRLNEALTNTRKNVLMLINRHGTNRYLAMSLVEHPSNGRENGRDAG
jgi:serine protease Do